MKHGLSFCEDFRYPPQIKELFNTILDTLISEKIYSIILSGSASRGEMTYLFVHNSLKIYSDIELIVVLRKSFNKGEIQELRRKVQDIELTISKQSKYYHIDIGFFHLSKLYNVPALFQFFETKETGILLYGQEVRHFFPKEVDIKFVNESTFERLFSLILYFPSKFFSGPISPDEERDYKYILARSILDIPTLVLSQERHFIAGFKKRIEFFKANYCDLGFDRFLPSWFLEFLLECWQGKLKMEFQGDLIDMYERILIGYQSVAEYLMVKASIHPGHQSLEERLIKYSPSLFHEALARRKIYELLLVLKNLKHIKTKKILDWLYLHKKGTAIALFFALNQACLAYLKRKNECYDHLRRAEIYMSQLDFRIRDIKQNNFIVKWLDIRKLLIEFLCFFYYSYAVKKDYLFRIIENEGWD